MTTITRWGPDTCECIIELEIDDDGVPKFLLMNEVCDTHIHLASTIHHERHHEMSTHVKDIIEQTKTRNYDTAVARYQEPRIRRSNKLQRELAGCIELVIQHNNSITEEWNELVVPPHAFDSHIHGIIQEENARKSNVREQFVAHYGESLWNWKFSGVAPQRILTVMVPKDHEEFRAKINHPLVKIE